MFLEPPFSALWSLLALLGAVQAQNSTLLSSEPPASSSVSSSLSPPSQFSPPLSTVPSSTSPVSSTYPVSSSISLPAPPAATNGFSIIGDVLKPTITSYTFDPFPAPSESSIPEVFPETYPDNPPPVGDSAIPNFGPAWAAAYAKAMERVGGFLRCDHFYFRSTYVSMIVIGGGIDARRKGQHHHWGRLDERPMCRQHPASWRFPWSLFRRTFTLSLSIFRRFSRCSQDSPLGVKFTDYVSVFPAGINAAAT